ncbi:hypothetical protein LguiB_015484 [Lonicera macranthoides]
MGKPLPKLQQLKRISAQLPKTSKPLSQNPSLTPRTTGGAANSENTRSKMDDSSSNNNEKRIHSSTTPLSEVVSDCVKRWFQDTHKEAKAGDLSMQVLLAQMYYTGYGVPRDSYKGKIWMTRASRLRTSVWKVSNKRPGYNASDSDSDELVSDS